MSGRCWKFLVVLLGVAGTVRAAEPALRFSRPIQGTELKQEELLAVPLDREVYAATRDGFPDLRVLNDQGTAVPIVLRKQQVTGARTVRKSWMVPTDRVSIKPRESGALEITVQLDDRDPAPNGLTLATPLRNFEERVSLEASADGKQWEPVGSEALIFDYSKYMDVRKESFSFPETSRKRLRIVIDKPTVEQESELLALTRKLQGKSESERTEKLTIERRPFRIERIEFWREIQEERATGDQKASYALSVLRVEENADKHQTTVYFQSQREPLSSLELESADRNFSRRVVVEVEQQGGSKSSWRVLADRVLSRIDFKNLKRQELSIPIPESRHTRYRLVIDNKDSPPLTVSGVKTEGSVYEVLFLAAPNRKYQLSYGSDEAKSPTYDTAAIQELLRSGFQPTRARLGAESAASVPVEPQRGRWSKLLNSPPLLISVISILVALLGYGLYHAMKRVDHMPRD